VDNESSNESHGEGDGRNNDPSDGVLLFFSLKLLSRLDTLLNEVLVRRLVRYNSEHAVCHVVDGVVASEERVTEKEEILLVSDNRDGADRAILTFGCVKNVVFRVHDVPVLVEHELEGSKLASLSALKGEESILDLVFFNAELPDKLLGEGDEVTLGHEGERSTGIEDGEDSSGLRMLVSSPGEGVIFALRSVGDSLAHR